MFVIMIGNPIDGITLYGDGKGNLFENHDEAVEFIEDFPLAKEDTWWIVPVISSPVSVI